MDDRWRIWIDTGGTFTDCLALDPQGRPHRAKVLSSSALRAAVSRRIDERRFEIEHVWPVADDFVRGFGFHWLDREHEPVPVAGFDAGSSLIELATPPPEPAGTPAAFELRSPAEAPVLAARIVTGAGAGRDLPPIDMRLASTRGTNALLERKGVPVALFISRGLRDLLPIGDQQRPDLFALRIEKAAPLYDAVVEVDERLAADGSVVTPLELEPVITEARRLHEGGVRVAAVALMHSYRNGDHEHRLAEALREIGFAVSCSCDLSPLIKLLSRTETAVVDAYLQPVLETYFKAIHDTIGQGRLHIMTSAGGLVRSDRSHAKDGLLSGPAGGVAGAAAAAMLSGFTRVIGFDMGGTSTDVARYDGDFEYQFEHRVGGARLVAPALAIETVAAGGGSICVLADGALHVGPQSASAVPGPACYGAGGPLTLTDVNLLLGRLDPKRFGIPVAVEHAEAALENIRRDPTGRRRSVDRESMLEGFLMIANQRMGDAIAEVSLRRGYDPRDYALVAFGGAAGQHACAVADHLGMTTIVMPADASLLSALGLGRAVFERFAERQVLRPLGDVSDQLPGWMDELGRQATDEVRAEGVPEADIEVRRRMLSLRLVGQETSIAVEAGDDISDEFAQRYEAMYGHRPDGKPIEVESIRVVASSQPASRDDMFEMVRRHEAFTERRARCRFAGVWQQVPVHERELLKPGAVLWGPALIFDSYSAYVIEPQWRAEVDGSGALVLKKSLREGFSEASQSASAAEVRQELFTNRFVSIARQMGRMLERTALSTNVKERLDFSCALLDADGELVAHAPHMPVHLGSLGLCVRAVREKLSLSPGDVAITNHPAFGGSHLPDVTVITPIHADGMLIGYAASRAHHAEIGGTRPGSMPPLARTLAEEGVVIEPFHLIQDGGTQFDHLEQLLREAPYPSRAVPDNLADVRAAVAANHYGAVALQTVAIEHGAGVVAQQMGLLKTRAERLARGALAALPDQRYEARETFDDGSAIAVAIDLAGDHAVIDFAGSAAVHPGNLNATPAVVRSAVIYVLRVMIGSELPLNEGIMGAVEVTIPPGMLNPEFGDEARDAPAVGGGNVETSQRLVDTLFKALGLCACSQGTMNNTLFGTDQFSYYETVCGGSGAGADFDGADAVHTHMTNTRITDPEILEQRYPVRLERFEIRKGSGGAGGHRGGDGAVREIKFLEPMSLSILSQHRTEGPYGLEGGEPGKPGAQHIVRADGEKHDLGSIDGVEVRPGDRLVLETPGAGGYGPPSGSSCQSLGVRFFTPLGVLPGAAAGPARLSLRGLRPLGISPHPAGWAVVTDARPGGRPGSSTGRGPPR